MISSATCLLLLSLLTILNPTNAKPTRTSRRGQGLIIPLTKRTPSANLSPSDSTAAMALQRDHLLAKYEGTMDNYERNTGLTMPGSKRNMTKRATGPQALILDARSSPLAWYGIVSVGTNPVQNLLLDFDTGSSDLWSSSYTPGSSSTNTGRPFFIRYGGGTEASGTVYTDTVSVAGLTATGQGFSTGTGVSGAGLPGFAQGIAGMAYQTLASSGEVPFVLNLKAQNQITNAVFGFRLGLNNPELYIGGTDSTRFTGSLVYSPVVTRNYWEIALQGVTVGATTVVSAGDGYRAIVDTGASAIQGPPLIVASFYATFPRAMTTNAYLTATGQATNAAYNDMYVAPCYGGDGQGYTYSRGTAMTFTLGGFPFVLPYAALVSSGIAPGGIRLNNLYYCTASLYGSTLNGDDHLWIIGDAFMLSTYAEFDFDNNRVGFAYST